MQDMGDGDVLLHWWCGGVDLRREWKLRAFKWHYDGLPQWEIQIGPLRAWVGEQAEWRMADDPDS